MEAVNCCPIKFYPLEVFVYKHPKSWCVLPLPNGIRPRTIPKVFGNGKIQPFVTWHGHGVFNADSSGSNIGGFQHTSTNDTGLQACKHMDQPSLSQNLEPFSTVPWFGPSF